MTRSRKAWVEFFVTRAAGLVVDILSLAAAYFAAFLLRFDFGEPRWGWLTVASSFVTVGLLHMFVLVACGRYRTSWRRTQLDEVPWFVIVTGIVGMLLTLLRYLTPVEDYMHVRPPYSVTIVYLVLSTLALVSWRLMWTWAARLFVHEETLLARDVRRMNGGAAFEFLRGKTVMVTGAGGSIGSELVRQVVLAAPKMLLLVERGENALYEIDRELRQTGTSVPLKPLMVDVNDTARMTDVFNFYRPEIVLHAAAYKHVPMVEMNRREGYRNNTLATQSLAGLACQFGVRRFVLISTDKAVNPVSSMGMTKRLAEDMVMRANDAGKTSFCAVRFGNVLGSSGSVVPLFREQIAHRLPVTVTHPEMKRYFMTIPEAVGLVLQAASRSEKAIYTLDMGEPVRILDLAEGMIRQAGFKPYVDIPIRFTGVRPGEKLFEELDISERSAYKTDMSKIYITKVPRLTEGEIAAYEKNLH